MTSCGALRCPEDINEVDITSLLQGNAFYLSMTHTYPRPYMEMFIYVGGI